MIRDWLACVCDPYHNTEDSAIAPEEMESYRKMSLGGAHAKKQNVRRARGNKSLNWL